MKKLLLGFMAFMIVLTSQSFAAVDRSINTLPEVSENYRYKITWKKLELYPGTSVNICVLTVPVSQISNSSTGWTTILGKPTAVNILDPNRTNKLYYSFDSKQDISVDKITVADPTHLSFWALQTPSNISYYGTTLRFTLKQVSNSNPNDVLTYYLFTRYPYSEVFGNYTMTGGNYGDTMFKLVE